MPAAEVDIDRDLVARLIATQRPDLSDLPVEFLANGWDNTLYRIGSDLVARLPRRAAAVDLTDHEATWLPQIAEHLPLPVPAPRFVGQPGAGYPWRWLIAPYLAGRPLGPDVRVDMNSCATQIGGFLAALHHPAPSDAPKNPFRGVPLTDRDGVTRHRLATLADQLDHRKLERLWGRALGAGEFTGSPLWIHGDLHPANVLEVDGKVAGVIDFGDLTAGDPATDLAIGWSMFDQSSRTSLWDAYGAPDDDLLERSRGWAISLGSAYLAHSADNPTMGAIGRRTLGAVLTEP